MLEENDREEVEGDDALTRQMVRIWEENDREEAELREHRAQERAEEATRVKESSEAINGKET